MRGVLLPRGPNALALPGSQTFIPTSQLAVPDGLVGHYSCNYDSVQDLLYLLDGTPFGNTGALLGTPVPAPVTRDGIGALKFDGITDYVNLLNSNNFGTGDFIVSLLVNPTSFAAINHEIALIHKITNWNSGNGWAIELSTYGGLTSAADVVVYFATDSSGSPTSVGTLITVNKWHNVILTRAGTTASLYIDGELKQSYTNARIADTVTTASSLHVGNKHTGWQNEFYNGLISDIRLYNRALDVGEAREIYASGVAGLRINPAIVSQWPTLKSGVVVAYLRPDADDSISDWTDQAGGTTTLYAALDETTASDSDYIQSPTPPNTSAARFRLSNPASGKTLADPVIVRYRFKKTSADDQKLDVTLKQGTTAIATWQHTGGGLTESFQIVAQTLSSGELASITDFDNLYIEFQASPP